MEIFLLLLILFVIISWCILAFFPKLFYTKSYLKVPDTIPRIAGSELEFITLINTIKQKISNIDEANELGTKYAELLNLDAESASRLHQRELFEKLLKEITGGGGTEKDRVFEVLLNEYMNKDNGDEIYMDKYMDKEILAGLLEKMNGIPF